MEDLTSCVAFAEAVFWKCIEETERDKQPTTTTRSNQKTTTKQKKT